VALGRGAAGTAGHGFEGNRAQFAAIVAALVERGFAAVALDVPAHGESAGDELTAVKFIAAIERTLARLAPVHAVIGHSLGAAMSLYSVAHTGGANRVALISAPSSLKRELNRFASAVGLLRTRPARRSSLRSRLMSGGRPPTSMSAASPGRSTCPLLLVHDQNDRQVPVLESARTAHVLPGAS
jgi:pimeloyl-ACP methyl ester carboxylesterase